MTEQRIAMEAMVNHTHRSGRNPLAIYLLGLVVTAGLSFTAGLLVGRDGSTPVEKLMPHGLVIAWYVLLFAGGLTSVIGVALRDLVSSLLIERAGLVALAPAASIYATALLLLSNYVTGLTVAAFAVACMARIWQIWKEIRAITRQSL